jgi:multiple sugar transport system permease protein
MTTATAGRVQTPWRGPGARDNRRKGRAGFIAYLVCGVVASVIFVAPLLWAVLRSLQPDSLTTEAPSWQDFQHLTLSNYSALLGDPYNILQNVGNSLIVSFATAVLTTIVSTLAGYSLGRFAFRGSGFVFALILVTMMVPFQALLTPLFLELQTMHLINSLAGIVLFYTTFNLPFGVFMMRNSFKEIPREMEDSARIDGASRMQMLVFVFRPLVIPGMATSLLYAFLFAWTEFLGALTFLTTDSKFTLPVALLNIESGTFGQVNFGYLIAGSVLAMIPCVILYVALQRYYVRGMMSGAVKG